MMKKIGIVVLVFASINLYGMDEYPVAIGTRVGKKLTEILNRCGTPQCDDSSKPLSIHIDEFNPIADDIAQMPAKMLQDIINCFSVLPTLGSYILEEEPLRLGPTLLSKMAEKSKLSHVQVLLENGANPNALYKKGESTDEHPAMLAIQNHQDSFACLQAIMNHGTGIVDPDMKATDGSALLHRMASRASFAVNVKYKYLSTFKKLAYLVEKGVPVNTADSDGQTALDIVFLSVL